MSITNRRSARTRLALLISWRGMVDEMAEFSNDGRKEGRKTDETSRDGDMGIL